MERGRLIFDDVSIDDLANDYKRKVFDLISLLQFKIAVFDCDGTLTAFQYSENRILPCNEIDLREFSKENNIYDNARVLKTMKYVIGNLNPDYVFVLTNSVDTIVDYKNKMLLSNFGTLKKENIIHTKSATEKMEKLKELYSKYNKQIIFVEDMATNIQLAEENLDFVKGYHISSLLA